MRIATKLALLPSDIVARALRDHLSTKHTPAEMGYAILALRHGEYHGDIDAHNIGRALNETSADWCRYWQSRTARKLSGGELLMVPIMAVLSPVFFLAWGYRKIMRTPTDNDRERAAAIALGERAASAPDERLSDIVFAWNHDAQKARHPD